MSAHRTFGALISNDCVCLVEYDAERTGMRVLNQWIDSGRSASIGEAVARLHNLLAAAGAGKASLSIAIEQFGVFHHVMTLPGAADDVLRPVIRREVQRVFGVTDPVIAFTRGEQHERREPPRAEPRSAPRQLFIAGAPRETIDALSAALTADGVEVQIATVVPKAIHSLYQASGGAMEPTAVLVVLEGGPHLSFFLEGRLELAIDPPIALEGERATVPMLLDQVERGAVYFRQQFRGATATRLLLATRAGEYDELAAALESRLGVQVKPLFAGPAAPEAVVAMGAVLEGASLASLDLFPHAPTFAERMSVLLRGPNLAVAGVAAAAAITGIWALAQFSALSSVRRETATLQADIQRGLPAVSPMRQIAERRADFMHQVEFVRKSAGERSGLADALQAIAQETPAGIRFDSLRVSRTASAWSAAIDGQAVGATAAHAVRNLEGFYNSVRVRQGVSAASLDQFDYPSVSGDSTHAALRGVALNFRLTFQIARNGGAAGAP